MKIALPTLLTVLFISTSSLLFAQSITINTAKEIAKNHIQAVGNGNLKSARPNQIKYQLSSAATDVENKDTLYFILSDTINKGFVIVAADKRSWPILGYSLEGNFDEANQPPAFVEWMENRKQEIAYIKKYNLQADSKTTQQWENLSSTYYSNATTAVDPLIQTKWNQSQYYNDKCPADANSPYGYNGHVPTGCTATSMAQVMKYWNYPTTGTGSNLYSHSTYGTLSANFGATTYQWAQMPNNVTSQNDAVATLMFHCGVSVSMDYGPKESGAGSPRNALVNYFSYSSDAQYVYKSSYSINDWVNLLKFELNSNRPIWYRGEGTGGHAFICDGYQNADYFHFNWGWGGYEDGYFYLGSLNPAGDNYNSKHGAIIKIFSAIVPDAIGAITGFTEVCQGQTSVTYSVPAIQNAASFTWTLPTGATGSSSTNIITVNFGATATSGTIKVKAQNSLGTTTESTLAIIVSPIPTMPDAITGKTMVCPGVAETYSISSVPGAVGYIWELPTGWTGNSTSTTISVTPANNSGTIKVKANNVKCSGVSNSLVVTVGVPVTPTNVSASLTSIILGQSTTLQVNGGALNSAPNWIWYTGSCGGTQIGTGTMLLVSPTATTTYYLQATGCGISTTCKSVTISVCSAPPAPNSSSTTLGSPANGVGHYIDFLVASVIGADGYSWEYSYDGTNWTTNYYQSNFTSLNWNQGDKPNIPVYLRVRSYKCSPKQYSAYTYTTPNPIYTASDVPAAPTVNGATTNTLNLTLNSETPVVNPAITTYSFFCSTTSQYLQSNGDLGSAEVFQTKSTWGTKTVTGLSGNTQYCFYAKAKNNDGDIRFDATIAACGTTKSGACISPTANVNSPSGASPLTSSCTATGGSGGIIAYKWYSGTSCSGTVLGTGSTLNVTESGSYTCKSYITGNESTCYDCATGYATIAATCSSPTTSVSSPSGTSPLTMTCTTSGGSGGTIAYKWYSGTSCTGTVLETSSTLNVTNSGAYSCKAYISGAESTCYNCASGYATITVQTCTNWAVTPDVQNVPSAGGSYQASVSASGACSYTRTFNDSWINLLSSNGSGEFAYTVDANTTCSSRTGTISVNDYTDRIDNIVKLTVIQAGLSTPSSVTVSGGGSYCGSTVLSANGGNGGTIYWQGATNNGTSLTTPSASQTVTTSGTFYFRPYSSGCGWGSQGSATVTINPTVIPSVSISASPSTIISSGQLVTFTATPINGGTNPTFVWKVNGMIVGNNSPTYSTSALTNGQVISCKLTSNSPCVSQASVASNSLIMTVIPVCTAPSAPTSCTTSIGYPANGLEHFTNLSCDIVSGADGYFFEYSLDGTTWKIDWGPYPGNEWRINHHEQPNVSLYYRVRAYKCDPMKYSNYTYASPQPIYTACDDPSIPAISGATTNSLNITLNAETPVENPSYTKCSIYSITTNQYVQANGTLGSYEVFQTRSTWGTKTVTGLSANKQYCFYAKAKNNDGDIRFNPANSACGITNSGPTLLQVAPVNYSTIISNHPSFIMLFDKTVFPGTGSLRVYKVNSTTPVLLIPITASMIDGNKVTVTYTSNQNGLDKNTNYYILVDGSALIDNAGNPFAGVNDSWYWNFKTGLNFLTNTEVELDVLNGVKIYPNPTTGIVEIEGLPENQKTIISIYTNNGKLIMKKTTTSTREKIDISKQVSGTYLLFINNQSVKVIKK